MLDFLEEHRTPATNFVGRPRIPQDEIPEAISGGL
jgi:hypothetical protein